MVPKSMISSFFFCTRIWKSGQTFLELKFFVTLNSSHDFLSMIFGFLGKFWIYMGKNVLKKKSVRMILCKYVCIYILNHLATTLRNNIFWTNLARKSPKNLVSQKSWLELRFGPLFGHFWTAKMRIPALKRPKRGGSLNHDMGGP